MITNNIVAWFSCSIWKSSEATRATELGFSVGDFKEYPVVSGSVFNEEYSEVLDSGTLVLSQVKLEDRLTLIKPYEYVRVFDKFSWDETTQTYGFDKIYLVDNFSERENNITKGERLFGYTIHLMSETKLLEKIQCPSLTITHKVNSDGSTTKKTILQYINQYIKLYSPRIKITHDDNTWSYERLIRVPTNQENSEFYTKFNVTCADMAFTNPTLRQILTTLMQQVGCIPILKNRVLSFLDFNKEGGNFFINNDMKNTVNYIDRSLSSDSFANTLVNMSENVLDSGNEVVSEKLGFRDGDSSYIKVEENMKLETRFPIYKIEEARLNMPASLNYAPNSTYTSNNSTYNLGLVDWPIIIGTNITDNIGYINFCFKQPTGVSTSLVRYISGTIGLCSGNKLIRKINILNYEGHFPGFFSPTTSTGNAYSGILSVSNNGEGTLSEWRLTGSAPSSTTYTNTYTLSINLEPNENIDGIWIFVDWRANRTDSSAIAQCFLPLGWRENITTVTTDISFTSSEFVPSGSNYSITVESSLISDFFNTVQIQSYEIRTPQTRSASTNVSGTNYRVDGNDYIVSAYIAPVGTDIYNVILNTVTGDITFNSTSLTYDSMSNRIIFAGRIIDGYRLGVPVSDYNWIIYYTYTSYVPGATNWISEGISLRQVSGTNSGYIRFSGTVSANDITDGVVIVNYIYSDPTQAITYNFQSVIQADVTPLFVENSVRQYLNTNFEKMTGANINTIEQLGQYLYGTVGYSIGSNEITGFSEVYTKGRADWSGWITEEYTYIENILNFLLDNNHISRFDSSTFSIAGGMPFSAGTVTFVDQIGLKPYLWVGNITFDLKYQPLNSFNLAYVKGKEAVDYALEQYDGNASGLTDFDRLSLHEQEQVDRIGNEVLTINQRTDNIGYIRDFSNGPLVYHDERSEENSDIDYVIFKRSFTIKNYVFQANYTGSKDAVLKDYFTSIRTKYRAYQYVDYNQSTLRKEKDVIFIKISKKYYSTGSSRLKLAGFSSTSEHFMDGFNVRDKENETTSVKYILEQGFGLNNKRNYSGYTSQNVAQLVKNDVSKIANDNSIAFIYEQYDNVGAGPRLNNTVVDTNIGGASQTWQFWSDSFRTSHIVGFLTKLQAPNTYYTASDSSKAEFIYKYLDDAIYPTLSTELLADMWGVNIDKAMDVWHNHISSIPNDNFFVQQINTVRLPVFEELSGNGQRQINFFDYTIGFELVDDIYGTLGSSTERTFYQDYAERLNHTIQFRYYSQTDDILWTEWFLRNSSLVNSVDYSVREFSSIMIFKILNAEEFEVKDDRPFGTIHKGSYFVGNMELESFKELIHTGSDGLAYYIEVQWSGPLESLYGIRITFTAPTGDADIDSTFTHDIIAFRRKSLDEKVSKFYFTFNDTKSDYVLKEKNHLLYRAYKANDNNTNQRTLKDLEDD